MKFTSAILLALASFAIAKGNNDDNEDNQQGQSSNSTGTSIKSQCNQIDDLTELTELAANATKLDKHTHGNATKAQEIQAKASTAATKLATLQSNTTLMTSCNQIFAVEDMKDACEDMSDIEEAQQIVANQTLLDKKTKNNATKAAEFKAKVAAKAADLTAMQSNTTLTAFCAAQNDKAACKKVAKLNKEQALAANTTALNTKFNGDATKVSNFQAKVSEKAQKLSTMMSNTTLMDTCQSLGISTAATTTTNTTTSQSTSNDSKSAAVSVNALAGGQIFALVSVFVYALTMM